MPAAPQGTHTETRISSANKGYNKIFLTDCLWQPTERKKIYQFNVGSLLVIYWRKIVQTEISFLFIILQTF